MPNEIRRDIFKNKVIISTGRSKRPGAFLDKKIKKEVCPFCPGKERFTGNTILALPNAKNWKIRIFPNKFPVVFPSEFKQKSFGFYQTFSPAGIHEILVETPEHSKDYAEFSTSDLVLILKALKKHYADLMRVKYVNYVTIFKNRGKRAGESIPHAHLQIIASSLFPKVIEEKMRASEVFFEENKLCGNCLTLKKELEKKERVVYTNNEWVCITSYTSTWPYQVSFLPKRHFSELTQMNEKEIQGLANIICKIFSAFAKLFPGLPYNMMYHNFPKSDFWHFHLEVYPRLVTHAGLEFFGLNVNIVAPEQAAKELKKKL